MNHRPNLKQMTALMDLLETMLSYVAEDTTLFQRLKSDLNKDAQAQGDTASGNQSWPFNQTKQTTTAAPEVGAPDTASPSVGMRDMKTN
jgi:hypothetical protein